MKKRMIACLSLEGVLCAAYVLLGQAQPNLFGTLVTFPFRQIALGLRALSLSGTAGNLAAVGLYSLFCLLPALYLIRRRRDLHGEDMLLPVLSGVLFFVMYLLINPHLQQRFMAAAYTSLGDVLLSTMVYSIAAGWVTMKVLRRCAGAAEASLMDYLRYLLMAVAAFLILGAFGTGLDGLAGTISALYDANQGSEAGLGLTVFFLVLQYLVDILPNLLSCGIILHAVQMLAEMKQEPWSDAVIACAEKLSGSCTTMLMVTVLSGISFNLLQLIFMAELRVVNGVIQIPLTTVLLVVALLLLARFIRSHKELKEENEFFI